MSPAEHLRPLEPLIGRWRRSGFILDDDGSTPRARCATASGRRGTKLVSSRGWARSHDRALGTRGQRPVGSVDEDAIRPGLDSRLSVRYLTPVPDAPARTETAVIAPTPEAEPLIGEHRQTSTRQLLGACLPTSPCCIPSFHRPLSPCTPQGSTLIAGTNRPET